ncbi:uncharacterized protein LOC135495169 isoform X2 [Lineus longissimus]|uniref:uncharacterized protein LOC135495169 isoform X2 n=1 Tax=Lineus longissimus TaxID=88925 RepID=UPI00315C95A4
MLINPCTLVLYELGLDMIHSYELEQTEGLKVKGRKGKALLWAILASCWSIIIILPTSLACVSIFIIYGKEDIFISPTDQYPISPISRTMCRYLDVQSPVHINMVLVNYPPAENGGIYNVTSPRLALELGVNKTIKPWKFHIIERSNVSFHLLRPVLNVTFLIIKGEENYESWSHSKGKCVTCVMAEYSLNQTVTSLPFYAKDTDLYYFIFKPQKDCEDQILPYVIYLNRRTYRLESNHMCFYTKLCSFDMFPKTYQKIYIDYEDLEQTFQPIRLTLTCHPREWIYLLCCFLLPVVLGVIITTAVLYYHKSYERSVTEQLAEQQYEEHECPELCSLPGEESPARRRFVPHLSDIEEVASVGSCDSQSSLLNRNMKVMANYAINSTTEDWTPSV